MSSEKNLGTGEPAPKAVGSHNFRSHSDIENFYRFVNDYNLRLEAKLLLQTVLSRLGISRKKRKNKKG
ncbi:MAG: hypothetical protein KBD63_04185 [Bacteriovoracaceae bacterium]|nr:hypothetical protein [Bacteriovoracaceae bacterium]